jgi:hypothetical protein
MAKPAARFRKKADQRRRQFDYAGSSGLPANVLGLACDAKSTSALLAIADVQVDTT